MQDFILSQSELDYRFLQLVEKKCHNTKMICNCRKIRRTTKKGKLIRENIIII